ncbi:Ubiquitin-like modifier-activating enzyme ATG7 [Zancudomyces culisetae]|uniref:Ubiquitin-like modifier-activating enzyme ATG7 n=1 Tax=Zancudomyces culisetae TaxID=1213189 RepID=A0A1R1PL85_ZANCU|nr:Ubiquitin-like modifier-activating enzyme ATG7 [Zancudomyces culisetae]OMH82573.1 Ubiquitin-like modifier-activating enzyme ATG7 [Zancudomyces culisetae]|eukprot:OMH81738.1 Ubiquitin-like modifier-activating enzyme ATG7 [Zancudomyces culisetae]
MNTIQFEPIKTTITPQFWTELMSFKLYDAKLDSQKVEIKGWYEGGRYKRLKAVLKPTAATSTSSTNKDQYNIYEAPATVSLQEFHSDSATSRDKKAQGWQCICGDLYNTNTIEEFLKLDRNNLMKEYTKQIQQDIESGRATKDPSLLFRFIATTFADLKKYKFYYWLGYPSIVEKVQSKGLSNGDNADLYSKLELAVDKYGEKEEYKRHTERKDGQTEIFCIGRRKGKNEIGSTQEGRSGQINIEDGSGNEAVWKIGNLVEWEDMEQDPSIEKVMVGFIDPTGNREKMGWMLRNIMVWLRRWHRKGGEEGGIEILSFRDYKYTENYQSLVVTVDSNVNEVGKSD